MSAKNSRYPFFAMLTLASLLAVPVPSIADSEHSHGMNRNLGHNNASDGVMGRITANHEIFYSGDPLQISISFPRGAALISSGEVDAYLLIFKPDADTIVLPVSNEASEENSTLFNIAAVDIESLPEGVYQLGLVITVPDGDPLNVGDWYNGLLGLITVRGLTVSGEFLDIDEDHDGNVDGDEDGDGFVDEPTDDGSNDATGDGTGDSGGGGTTTP